MRNFAHLKRESPFYDVFPHGAAPIKNIIAPSEVRLEGCDETQAYMLAIDQCTEEQLEKVALICAQKFADSGQTSLAGIEKTKANVRFAMRDMGMPIRMSQVDSVSTDCPAFL